MNIETILIIALLWVLLSPRFAFRLYTRFLLVPHKSCGTPEERALFNGLGGQEVYFANAKGTRLRGCYFRGKRRENTQSSLILYSMGADGDMEKRVAVLSLLLKNDLPIFIYEYSGFGLSEGKPSLSNTIADAQAAFDFVVSNYKKAPSDIILYGESFGGAISTRLMTRYSAGALIIKSSFSSLARIAHDHCWPLRLYPSVLFPPLDTAKSLQSIVAPVMIIHGHHDRKIHRKHAKTLYANCQINKAMLWLPDSRHAFMSESDEISFASGVSRMLEMVESIGLMTRALCDCHAQPHTVQKLTITRSLLH